jgi:hypothetical protein
MVTRALIAIASIALASVTVPIAPAEAQQARSFVSGLGNDANAPNCTRTAPCRTFQKAHDNTLSNGEITVLDAGSYGAVIINRNISIINDGVGEAGALVSGGGNGISIAAPVDAAVTLRGLTIKGIGFGGGNGIVFVSGAALNLENCTIRNLDTTGFGFGLIFEPNQASTLRVLNTVITDNLNTGIYVAPQTGAGAGTVFATFDQVHVARSYGATANGFMFDTTPSPTTNIEAVITDSISSSNNSSGFYVKAAGPGIAVASIVRSTMTGNQFGVTLDGSNTHAILSSSAVVTNNRDWQALNGAPQLDTHGDNTNYLNALSSGPAHFITNF